ncbi:MAG: BT_3928 family protein [Fermentimonas sp.]|jgi:uncharacterized membrane protein YphA (DoxX/SURF4 family)
MTRDGWGIERFFVELSRIVVGATFLFSGFVKSVDPYGFAYKIEDYLIKMNLTELFPLALFGAVCLVVVEFALGAMLLLGVYRKWTTRLIGLIMVVFTPFTLWVAIANPVPDCGCFGDALIITNWQTFYKNVVLLVAIIYLVVKWQKITPLFSQQKKQLAVTVFIVVFGLSFALYNINFLPIIDFRPYKVGNNIPEQMYVDPEKADVYESVFIYSKDGIKKEFTEDNYPWDDSTWVFEDMSTRLVKEGVKPAIEDFRIDAVYYDEDLSEWKIGGDITDLVLSEPSYSFLAIAYSLENMSDKHIDKFVRIRDYADSNDMPFYFVTASSQDVIGKWERENNTAFQLAHADERVLKTMIRSNPGLMLLKEGTVVGKWDDSRIVLPDNNNVPIEETGMLLSDSGVNYLLIRMIILSIIFFVPLLIIYFIKCND